MTGIQLAQTLALGGYQRAIVTDVATDGMFTGPNFGLMTDMAKASGLSVIASGGVADMGHLAQASLLESAGLEGIIIGKAIYEKGLNVADAEKRFKK